jgi:hypothetical protein
MLPRRSSLILVASTAVGLLAVHSCIMLGGAMREAAVAFCAFALLIGAPIVILAWFGSLSDLSEKDRQRSGQLKRRRSEALLWQSTLIELQASARSEHLELMPARAPDLSGGASSSPLGLANVASAPRDWGRSGRSRRRPILALIVSIAASLGLMGCYPPAPLDTWMGYPPAPLETWSMVHPGMGTTELVGLMGAPNQIKSNGTTELWQYCRDNFFGRKAKYYMAVLIDGQEVRELRPYPVASRAGCEDFYRVGF